MNGQIGPSQAPRCRTRWPLALAKHGLVHSVWRVPSLLTTQYLARYCGHRFLAWLDGIDIAVAAIPARTATDHACLRENFMANPLFVERDRLSVTAPRYHNLTVKLNSQHAYVRRGRRRFNAGRAPQR